MDKMHVEKITGTGSSITVKPGFKPSFIEVINTSGLVDLKFIPDLMTDGTGIKQVTDGTMSLISSAGIVMANDNMTFTIGADTDVNASGEVLTVLAFR